MMKTVVTQAMLPNAPGPKQTETLSDAALQAWLSYSFAPMSLLHLLDKHDVPLGACVNDPFAQLNPFWRKQMPPVEPGVLNAVKRWLDEDESHQVICQASAHYPAILGEISCPPRLLYTCGDTRLLHQPMLAIVGSRRASPYGLNQAQEISSGLVRHGWGICSGMAMGIDGAAHQSALQAGGSTVAVLGCGVDICYPPRQRSLYQELKQHALVVSEFYPGAPAKSDHFLRRNRIISGLCQGVFVVEAGLRSGSLSTARFGLEQNRLIFALPGPVTQQSYTGNHKLIQQGAYLVTSAEDILAELPVLKSTQDLEVSGTKPDIEGQKENQRKPLANQDLLANVGFETTSIDSLVTRTRLPVAALMNQLISLELDGWVTAVPGGYVRVRRE
ncbi:MAG: DNA-processing protein DprA [Idiomarina sp.]|nr:DNA-processing protein DprA [Idiomarina sp.]